jgi:hypothetical protein
MQGMYSLLDIRHSSVKQAIHPSAEQISKLPDICMQKFLSTSPAHDDALVYIYQLHTIHIQNATKKKYNFSTKVVMMKKAHGRSEWARRICDIHREMCR